MTMTLQRLQPVVAATFALFASASAFGPKGAGKKNVLYFIADDLRPEFAAPYWQKQVASLSFCPSLSVPLSSLSSLSFLFLFSFRTCNGKRRRIPGFAAFFFVVVVLCADPVLLLLLLLCRGMH